MKRSNAGKTTPCPSLSSAVGNEGRFQMVGLEELIMAAAIRACAESAESSDTPIQTGRGKPKGEQKTSKKANDSGNESREENAASWENFETFSPQKMSWMLQEVFNQTAENRKLIDKLLQTTDKTQPSTNPRDCERCFTRWLNRLGEHPRNDSWEDYLDDEDDDDDYEDEDDDDDDDEALEELRRYWFGFRANGDVKSPQQLNTEDKLRNDAAASSPNLNQNDPKCPFESMEILNQVEEKLLNEASYASRLMNYQLLILPGQDPKQFLENILRCLLTDELAIQFTYKGKAPLNSFKELLLCEVIKKTVRKKFPIMEERFFSERIGAWLVYRKREHSAKLQSAARVSTA